MRKFIFYWTLDVDVATSFAVRDFEDRKILYCVVQPKDIIHYFNDNKQEIIVYPGKATGPIMMERGEMAFLDED